MLKAKWLILTNSKVQNKSNLKVCGGGLGRSELIKPEKNGRKEKRGGKMRVGGIAG